MANQFLGLSLFVMLLSFFIILNALSDFDPKKARPVLNSIDMAFDIPDPTREDVSDIESSRMAESKGTTLDKIQGLFAAHITGVEAKSNRLGTELRMRMPYDVFEREMMSSLTPKRAANSVANVSANAQGFFIPTLVSLLDTEGDTPYKMDMVVHVEGDFDKRSERAKKIAMIAGKIERAGLPSKMVTAGLGAEKPDTVDLYFRQYRPFDPNGFRQGGAQ